MASSQLVPLRLPLPDLPSFLPWCLAHLAAWLQLLGPQAVGYAQGDTQEATIEVHAAQAAGQATVCQC
jgi:hypothetical protein